MEEIISKTIYKEKDLESLFAETKERYAYMSENEIDAAILKVRSLLDQ